MTIERKRLLLEGQPVIILWDPDKPAKLIRLGEQVSEVQFADGHRQYLNNDQLKPVKT